MSPTRRTALALPLALLLPTTALAQPAPTSALRPTEAADAAALRAALSGDKRDYVASAIGLTEDEAPRFWPVYTNYQRQLDTTTRRRARLVEEVVALDRPLTDTYAKRLAAEMVAIDDEETRDAKRVASQVVKVLPPKKALRYLQIESKVRAIRAYDIAATMPLAK